jgi:5,5'-dehydrodivanillate O-demethylase
MPNIHELRIPAADAEATHETLMRWTVPLDDDRSLVFRLRSLPVTADKASAYLERRAGSVSKEWSSVRELGERVLAGELQFQDLKDHTTDKVVLTHAQDYAVQVGQGPIPDRTNEHLGRSDVGVILFRKVWVRELNALKTGRPLKKWLRPETMNVLYDPGNKQQKMVRVPAPRQV